MDTTKKSLDSYKTEARELSISEKQLQSEVEKLKENVFEFHIKLNEIETEKKKIEQANDRAQSQNMQITKEREMYK